MQVPAELPFRGPEIYTKGDYHYHCKVDGEFVWFQGCEEIFYMDEKYMSAIFMELKDKLQLLRKQNGYSQEQLADKLGIARQTLSKWENGQAVPELSNLISLSNLYGITIDRIVKDDDE